MDNIPEGEAKMDYYGYVGTILHVNLTTGEIRKEPLDLELARNFIGGVGINHRLAYDLIKPRIDPLSPENPIIIGVGPLVGTFVPGTARVMGTTKFPLTGAIATAGGSMRFGCMLKWAGYDHIVITGKAKRPVYLKIIDDDVELCDAKDLWGKDISQTTEELWDRYQGSGVIAIGQGGENLVKFALALVDKAATFGRGGLGAVMGSKNLKAMVARGAKEIRISDSSRLKQLVDSLFERARTYPLHKTLVDLGVMENWPNYAKQILHHKNFTEVYPEEKSTELFGPTVYKKIKTGRIACPSCFICDKDILEVKEGEYKGLVVHTASFLNTGIISTRLGIEDCGRGLRLTDLLDRYGLGMLTFSSLLDFILFLHEQGIITEEDVGGLPLNRDFDTILTWLDKITFRQGFGDVLADGWLETIKKIGKDSEKHAYIVKGQDCLWEPRWAGLGTMELEQVVCPRGPTSATGGSPTYVPGIPIDVFKRHSERMGASKEAVDRIFDSPLGLNVGRLTRYSEDWYSVLSSLGICNRHMNNRFYHVNTCAELYSAVTGIQLSPRELMEAADRAWNMLKVLNVREGFDRKDDKIPDKWFEPMKTAEGEEAVLMDYYKTKTLSREDVNELLDDYYDERGWDREKGIPTKEKLTELGLKDIADDLEKLRL